MLQQRIVELEIQLGKERERAETSLSQLELESDTRTALEQEVAALTTRLRGEQETLAREMESSIGLSEALEVSGAPRL